MLVGKTQLAHLLFDTSPSPEAAVAYSLELSQGKQVSHWQSFAGRVGKDSTPPVFFGLREDTLTESVIRFSSENQR